MCEWLIGIQIRLPVWVMCGSNRLPSGTGASCYAERIDICFSKTKLHHRDNAEQHCCRKTSGVSDMGGILIIHVLWQTTGELLE